MELQDELSLEDALDELVSAEDFLEYFGVPFDPAVVHVNRLHIMQRYHDYLSQSEDSMATHLGNDEALRSVYRALLERAYSDFVESDALTEKVFKVFRMHEPQTGFVPLDSLL
ncbi:MULTISPECIES: nitrogenase-stabilizing/protective protein NifW [unclassified Oceanobacter]|jgi:nitrogenase-stabilizing/protective protein|uniref:nitrogenase-stabilizing/protective protein NifW n=1 Tax=unclassified Oceanobacter TaxID=2620260 RepID=UPI0026E32A2F|nr:MULTISPECIES: nitrogenase-stabilizing/protective protein NifW [unclassified Oceanobacter]MDO6682733.1 nitrogenase-stabilizing/protective protein NifW [Oceanobacter sp. 5_MG-2023]MDP2507211.1 nitrogenase-stabilizing/protective protein NifW [Oceanobacter sp. 3_MG-2023]MDP2549119.1 nitrogenase-stabilizing/protective protein NifW [Oceanobacter sp. 4_MG-2023]MDP2609029.1 nitrogenase-stabilizing/protective protein NifW [Oceanobacter sp. 1_MG-2023]MDP2612351.1 nitrogenase-stabilizing/protective pr